MTVDTTSRRKLEWQREKRRKYAAENGWSTSANERVGGRRQEVLERDGYACVSCGMTDEEHRATWGRPITIDHISRDRSNNCLENLQTLCLSCHGRKDISSHLIAPQVPAKQPKILALRATGATYQQIADQTEFSIGAVWKWIQLWSNEPEIIEGGIANAETPT